MRCDITLRGYITLNEEACLEAAEHLLSQPPTIKTWEFTWSVFHSRQLRNDRMLSLSNALERTRKCIMKATIDTKWWLTTNAPPEIIDQFITSLLHHNTIRSLTLVGDSFLDEPIPGFVSFAEKCLHKARPHLRNLEILDGDFTTPTQLEISSFLAALKNMQNLISLKLYSHSFAESIPAARIQQVFSALSSYDPLKHLCMGSEWQVKESGAQTNERLSLSAQQIFHRVSCLTLELPSRMMMDVLCQENRSVFALELIVPMAECGKIATILQVHQCLDTVKLSIQVTHNLNKDLVKEFMLALGGNLTVTRFSVRFDKENGPFVVMEEDIKKAILSALEQNLTLKHFRVAGNLLVDRVDQEEAFGFNFNHKAQIYTDMNNFNHKAQFYTDMNRRIDRKHLLRGEATEREWIDAIAAANDFPMGRTLSTVYYLLRQKPALCGGCKHRPKRGRSTNRSMGLCNKKPKST